MDDRTKLALYTMFIVVVGMLMVLLIVEPKQEAPIEEVHLHGETVEATLHHFDKYEVPSDFEPIADCKLSEDIQEYAYFIAKAYGIDYNFLMAVMFTESAFKKDAVAGGNYGLMMINEINLVWLEKELGVTDILDPYQNIQSGAYILSIFFEKFEGDANKTLMAYNMGETGARRLWNQGIYETRYTQKVAKRMAETGVE